MPASTAAAEPVCAVATTTVGLPVLLDVKVSPAWNSAVVLFVPVFAYFTNIVSGSGPSVADTFTTSAITPEVPPVSVPFK